MTNAEQRLRAAGIIPILRRVPPDRMPPAIAALIAGGITALEITLDSPGALDAIRQARTQYDASVLIGAGTVMSREDLRAAHEAGAQFVVSPHLDPDLVRAAISLDLPPLPGVLTPTEIAAAERAGARLLKIFPAGPLGPAYIKDLLGPFAGRAFFPTGGITPENASAYLAAGATAVGMGSALLSKDLIAAQNWPALTARVQTVLDTIRR